MVNVIKLVDSILEKKPKKIFQFLLVKYFFGTEDEYQNFMLKKKFF